MGNTISVLGGSSKNAPQWGCIFINWNSPLYNMPCVGGGYHSRNCGVVFSLLETRSAGEDGSIQEESIKEEGVVECSTISLVPRL